MGTEIRYKTTSGWFLDQAESSGEEMAVSLGPADIDNSRILELVFEEADSPKRCRQTSWLFRHTIIQFWSTSSR
jgi:hypothetical protein